MGFIAFIILGGLAGWIASMITGRNAEQGILGNIISGVIGAFVGGWIMNLFGNSGVTGFNIRSFFVALVGAIVVLFIYNMIKRRSNRHAV